MILVAVINKYYEYWIYCKKEIFIDEFFGDKNSHVNLVITHLILNYTIKN